MSFFDRIFVGDDLQDLRRNFLDFMEAQIEFNKISSETDQGQKKINTDFLTLHETNGKMIKSLDDDLSRTKQATTVLIDAMEHRIDTVEHSLSQVRAMPDDFQKQLDHAFDRMDEMSRQYSEDSLLKAMSRMQATINQLSKTVADLKKEIDILKSDSSESKPVKTGHPDASLKDMVYASEIGPRAKARAYNALIRSGITTINDFGELSHNYRLQIRGLGIGTVRALEDSYIHYC